MNSQHKKHEENYSKPHHNQIAQTVNSSWGKKKKKTCYKQRNKDKDDNTFLARNKASEKTVEQHH